MSLLPDALRPDWPAPARVLALMSSRAGGVSAAPFDSLNLRPAGLPLPAGEASTAVDAPEAVQENQRRFAAALGAAPVWLQQVHGSAVLRLSAAQAQPGAGLPVADASICTEPGIACTVLVADCLPLLLCSVDGTGVGAVHAGWRGLAGGVVERSVAALCNAADTTPDRLLAWIGPCIGPQAFEVGAEVLQAFGADPRDPDPALFRPSPRADGSLRWRADLAGLTRRRLAQLGLVQVSGGRWCTASDASRFFSFRRDGRTGRLAAAVALRD